MSPGVLLAIKTPFRGCSLIDQKLDIYVVLVVFQAAELKFECVRPDNALFGIYVVLVVFLTAELKFKCFNT